MAYSLCPDLNIRRLIVTSAYSIGRAPSLLSMVSVTSARPSGAREVVPAKTTSSILPPRSDLAPCSPITQDRASTMLDLPEPFGPTTQVMPGSRRSEVAEANDLKPRRVRLFRYKCRLLSTGRPGLADLGWPTWAGRPGLADLGWPTWAGRPGLADLGFPAPYPAAARDPANRRWDRVPAWSGHDRGGQAEPPGQAEPAEGPRRNIRR